MSNTVTSYTFVDAVNKDFSEAFAIINPANSATYTQILEAHGAIATKNTIVQKLVKTLSKNASGGKAEGANAADAEKSTRTPVQNVMEIFSKTAKVSGTAKAMNAGAYQEEIHDRMSEIKEDINANMIDGTFSNADPRKMKGFTKFAKNTVPVADVLTEDELDLALQKLVTKGDVRLAVAPADILAVQRNLIGDKAAVAYTADTTKFGVKVWEYVSAQGTTVKIYTEPALATGHYLVYDMDKVEYHELRPIHVEDLGKIGDADAAQVIAEVTFVPNPDSVVNLIKG